MDGGHKPANKIIATLKAIKMDPSLISKAGVEPEALAMVASNYQRGEEKPGTSGLTLTHPMSRSSRIRNVSVRLLQSRSRV
jgi:hypothetical protein